MDYLKHYNLLIIKRRNDPIDRTKQYAERHHIIPVSEGGSSDPSNLVDLTAREHYIAHLLLERIYQDESMLIAITMMRCSSKFTDRSFKFNNRLYEAKRQQVSALRRGRQLSHETRLKIAATVSEKTKGENNPMYGKKLKDCMDPADYERWKVTRKGCTIINDGNKEIFIKKTDPLPEGFVYGRLPSTRAKLSKSLKGKPVSPEAIQKGIETKRRNGTLKRSRESVEKQFRTRRERGIPFETTKGKIWVNNGVKSMFWSKDDPIPVGFVKGRLKLRKENDNGFNK